MQDRQTRQATGLQLPAKTTRRPTEWLEHLRRAPRMEATGHQPKGLGKGLADIRSQLGVQGTWYATCNVEEGLDEWNSMRRRIPPFLSFPPTSRTAFSGTQVNTDRDSGYQPSFTAILSTTAP